MTPGGTRLCRQAFVILGCGTGRSRLRNQVSRRGSGDVSTASLLIVEGVGRGTRFQIGRQRVGIGRSSENSVRIEDSEASRFHAAIQWQDVGFTLTDLGSANGTLLNGVRVETAVIVSGDQLQVASTLLAFQVHGATSPRGRVPVDLVAGDDDRSSIVSETADVMYTTRSGGLDGGASDLLAGDLSADIAEDWSVNEVEALASLGALYRISEQVADPAATLDTILVTILDVALEVVSADRGCVLMASAETGVPEPRVYRARSGNGGGELDEVPVMPVPRSIVDLVMTGGRGVRTSDAQRDDRFSGGGSILQAGVREAVCAPLVGRQAVLGAIYLDTTTRVDEVVVEGEVNERLSEESLRLLVSIGRQAALAIDGQRNQQALVQAERLAAVGQTIATLSHHIKNILQGVRGGSYLINLGLKDHDEQLIQRGWGIVDRNQGRIYDLVMDMLTYSTDRTPAWKRTDVSATVSDVCELLQSRADEARVVLERVLPEGPTEADYDPEGIHRAVLNVVTNAIDAVEGRADAVVVVGVGVDLSVGAVFVDIDDNGPGVPEDELPRLFSLFASTKGARGTGLGLAVSRKIIGEHGGEIQVENRPGTGCRFRLTWPVKAVLDEAADVDDIEAGG
ncbi:MAG TPA: histidine kinase [Planctomycetaceae bacterium]|nr:histidine kinase [Planctomycetaceae bacterium]